MTNLRERAAEAQAGLREFMETAPQRAAEQAPDVDASGIAADLSAPVGIAWMHVMADVQYVSKEYNNKLKYEVRGIDAVLNTVGPVLRKHGVSVVPIHVTTSYEQIKTTSGALMMYCRVNVQYSVLGPTGDVLAVTLESAGEAFDSGDKSTAKAMSVALRTLYLNALAIPTNRQADDPEYSAHELAAPAPPTPADYHAEILRETTSLNRLRQIRAEFGQHPDIAAAEVETETGERITLGSLLTRIGREKQNRTGDQ